jgi:Domain of unknown function (DUF6471)
MSNTTDWDQEAKLLLKAELARRGVTYRALSEKLEVLGISETEGAIASKISRGRYSMVFFLQCMNAVGASDVSVAVQGSTAAEITKS